MILLGGRVSRSTLCLYTKNPPPPSSTSSSSSSASSTQTVRTIDHASFAPSTLRPRLPRLVSLAPPVPSLLMQCPYLYKRRVLTPPPRALQGLSSKRVRRISLEFEPGFLSIQVFENRPKYLFFSSKKSCGFCCCFFFSLHLHIQIYTCLAIKGPSCTFFP